MRSALLVLAAAIVAAGPAPRGGHDGKIAFIHDIEFGLAKAKLESKAVMLFFTADWWGYCGKLAAAAFSDDKVAAAATRVVPVYVDCTDRSNPPEITKKYGVSGYPTVLYTDPEGKKIKDIVGQNDANAYIGAIDNVAKKLPGGRPTFWNNTLKSAAATKKKVALYVAKEGADPIKVTMKLNKDLGDRKTKLAWTWETGTAKVLEARELQSAPAILIFEAGEKDEMKLLGKVTGEDAKLVNQGIDDILKDAK